MNNKALRRVWGSGEKAGNRFGGRDLAQVLSVARQGPIHGKLCHVWRGECLLTHTIECVNVDIEGVCDKIG